MIDRKEYLYKYHKEKLKRVPLDLPLEMYQNMKEHALSHDGSVNGFIKRAIKETINRDNSKQQCLEGLYFDFYINTWIYTIKI